MSPTRKTFMLCVLLHIYIAFSALIFQHFESEEGQQKISKLREMKSRLANVCHVTAETASRLIDETLYARTEDHNNEMRKSWENFASAVWFVMTLFTTVGTGHIVPQTFNGRLFCMISSLFGIPLYALFLKHAGDHVINLLRIFIVLLETRLFKKESDHIKNMNIKILISAFVMMTAIILIGALGCFAFRWTYFEGIYFCFISLSTVGFGDLVPTIDSSTKRQVFSCLYMFFNVMGLTIVSCFITSLVNSMEDISLLWRSFKDYYLLNKLFVSNYVSHEITNNNDERITEEQGKD